MVEPPQAPRSRTDKATVALVGNPNAGKTSLFNRLTGLRAQTANFAGTTVSHRRGALRPSTAEPLRPEPLTLVDLPGLYSHEATSPEEAIAYRVLTGEQSGEPKPDAVVIVVDATNLERNLPLAAETLALGLPALVALNMSDLAERLGLEVDLEKLSGRLGCPVARVSARTGEGIESLVTAIHSLVDQKPLPQLDEAACACTSCSGCGYASRFDWAESVRTESLSGDLSEPSRLTDALDTVLTHRVGGLVAFALVMFALFMTIFSVATVPMDLIDSLFAWGGDTVGEWLPEGDLKSLVVDGLIGGVGGMLVFLPQICLLFFLLALLEGSGYLARAALVMDRLMQRVGLPGKAFVPMLSAHACAIPAIMASRVVDDRRDRLVTILVAPLLSCSARVPVYVMVIAMLFPDSPLLASLAFAGGVRFGHRRRARRGLGLEANPAAGREQRAGHRAAELPPPVDPCGAVADGGPGVAVRPERRHDDLGDLAHPLGARDLPEDRPRGPAGIGATGDRRPGSFRRRRGGRRAARPATVGAVGDRGLGASGAADLRATRVRLEDDRRRRRVVRCTRGDRLDAVDPLRAR